MCVCVFFFTIFYPSTRSVRTLSVIFQPYGRIKLEIYAWLDYHTRFEIHNVKADLFNGARGGGIAVNIIVIPEKPNVRRNRVNLRIILTGTCNSER